jgi:hypothetical protein
MAFLREVIAASPNGVLDPLPSNWDAPVGGVAGEYEVTYLGFSRPRFRELKLPEGKRWAVDVIDTWNMTVERVADHAEGTVRVSLPGREHMAIRILAEK